MAPTILIVEDDAIQREGLRTVLEAAGYRVALAADPAEAVEQLHQEPVPALILLDMMFPSGRKADGWSFLRERQRWREIRAVPVVITTAMGNASAEWAASLGASGYLRKLFDVGAMLDEVRRWAG